MPDILKGYCEKSDKPREVAEEEAKEFLQVIEDSASYQFGLTISPFFVNSITQGCTFYEQESQEMATRKRANRETLPTRRAILC